MRKRLIIGAIAVVVIGFAAYFLLPAAQPQEGTVEYHKARFNCGCKKIYGGKLWKRTVEVVNRGLGTKIGTITDAEWAEVARGIHANCEALLRLGYLVERDYHLTNTTVADLWSNTEGPRIVELLHSLPKERLYLNAFGLQEKTGNVLRVVASREDIPVWDKFIAVEDAPRK